MHVRSLLTKLVPLQVLPLNSVDLDTQKVRALQRQSIVQLAQTLGEVGFRVAISVNLITIIYSYYAVWITHTQPPSSFYINVIHKIIDILGWTFFLYKKKPITLMYFIFVTGSIYVLGQVWVNKTILFFLFAIIPVIYPIIVLPWRTSLIMLLSMYITFTALVFIDTARWDPYYPNYLALFIGTSISVVLLVIPVLVVSYAVQVVFTQAAKQTLQRQIDIAEKARISAEARSAENLAAERERTRIARELHDSLGHDLTAINLQLRGARKMLTTNCEAAETAVEAAYDKTRNALAELRHAVAALREKRPEQKTFIDNVATMLRENKSANIQADLVIQGPPYAFPNQIAYEVYRVIQEALTNVWRHAHATRVVVNLNYVDSHMFRLSMQDNGQGVSRVSKGFGLTGIHERIEQLGGRVCIVTAPGQGFRIDVEVPV